MWQVFNSPFRHFVHQICRLYYRMQPLCVLVFRIEREMQWNRKWYKNFMDGSIKSFSNKFDIAKKIFQGHKNCHRFHNFQHKRLRAAFNLIHMKMQTFPHKLINQSQLKRTATKSRAQKCWTVAIIDPNHSLKSQHGNKFVVFMKITCWLLLIRCFLYFFYISVALALTITFWTQTSLSNVFLTRFNLRYLSASWLITGFLWFILTHHIFERELADIFDLSSSEVMTI